MAQKYSLHLCVDDGIRLISVLVRFSGAATIEQYIMFVGIRYRHVRCTNSKLRVLYTHDLPAK